MSQYPRILALASAHPQFHYTQAEALEAMRDYALGADWRSRPEQVARARDLERAFAAARVAERDLAVDVAAFYQRTRTTGERMAMYGEAAHALGRSALEGALIRLEGSGSRRTVVDISDLYVISCTGYTAPGLDILLARDLALAPPTRRVVVGHMGCYGALVGLRECLAATRAHHHATAAMLCVELSSLHLMRTDDMEVMTSFALFGDAAAALVMGYDAEATGPEIVATHTAADFNTASQMTWNITDDGFELRLSPRIPVTLRRNVRASMEALLAPHGLDIGDIGHWIVHPGGPSILEAIGRELRLPEDAMALSWKVLAERGNCSSGTVLLILEELLRSGKAQAGEWGVMMAFGPGLTLESCLMRF